MANPDGTWTLAPEATEVRSIAEAVFLVFIGTSYLLLLSLSLAAAFVLVLCEEINDKQYCYILMESQMQFVFSAKYFISFSLSFYRMYDNQSAFIVESE